MVKYGFKTDIGKIREKNEDTAIIVEKDNGDILMLVLDGMGGHRQGDIASIKAQNYICKAFEEKSSFSNVFAMKHWMKVILKKINKFLNDYTKADASSKGMGATLACYLIHDDKVIYSYIGDTRAYIIKNNEIIQISEDETYVQFLYEAGKIKKEEMSTHPSRHIVTNAIGCYETAIINVKELKRSFDYLLLCSDGLYNMVDNSTIYKLVKEKKDISASIDELIDLANSNGGLDNIAIAILKNGE